MSSQVLSGDSVIIRGQPKGGPPPEKTLFLSNIVAPKLGRRAINRQVSHYHNINYDEAIIVCLNLEP